MEVSGTQKIKPHFEFERVFADCFVLHTTRINGFDVDCWSIGGKMSHYRVFGKNGILKGDKFYSLRDVINFINYAKKNNI